MENKTEKAIFDGILMLDEKITKLTNRFESLLKTLGYKIK